MDELQQAREKLNGIDRTVAELFEERMHTVEAVARYKEQHGLPVLDSTREAEVLQRNAALLQDASLREYYLSFQRAVMEVSKQYQRRLLSKRPAAAKVLTVQLGEGSYDIIIERGCLQKAGELLNLARRVLIVTDDGVPPVYAETLAKQCKHPVIVTVPAGEGSKSVATYEALLRRMLAEDFTRTDCVAAVGGGVCGDLAGFVAASYQRGVDFYNIPTTLLAQVDSSIGGKVAINLDGIKNIVGAFYRPRRVLVDADTLRTLSARQLASGMAEALKMACTFDAEAFALFEQDDPLQHLDAIIEGSLVIKKRVVEADEKEQGLRRMLNFGHTVGHGIESADGLGSLYHGECVALGMLPMCSPEVHARLLPILQKLGLPTALDYDPQAVWQAIRHDKKFAGDQITVAWCDTVGRGELKTLPQEELYQLVKEALGA